MKLKEVLASASIPTKDGEVKPEDVPVPTSGQLAELLSHLKQLSDAITSQRRTLREQRNSLLGRATSPSGSHAVSKTSSGHAGASKSAPNKAAGSGATVAAASAGSPATAASPPLGSSAPRTLPRIRIKHDAASPTDPKAKAAGSPPAAAQGGDSADWDEGPVQAPGRTNNKKSQTKRKRKDDDDDGPARSDTADSAGLYGDITGSAATSALPKISGFKLRTAPAAQRRGSEQAAPSNVWAQRKGSLLGSTGSGTSTGFATPMYDAAWALPTMTPDSFVPKIHSTTAPKPYPTHPEQVHEDFAAQDWREREKARDGGSGAAGGATGSGHTSKDKKGKEVQQVPLNTFYTYADGFFKSLTEDDLAWLSSTQADDLEPFQIPPLGKHYREVWDSEDAAAEAQAANAAYQGYPAVPVVPSATAASSLPAKPPPPYNVRFVPSTLGDRHLVSDEAKSGPLTEKIVASFFKAIRDDFSVGSEDAQAAQEDKDQEAKKEDDDGDAVPPNNDSPADTVQETSASLQQDTLGFEDRLRAELKALDLLDDPSLPNAGQRQDDEVSATLRKVQAALRKQMRINEARKMKLFELAKNRMSYQEYLTCLNHIERDIEAGWNKRQRQIKNSALKKKKTGGSGSGASSSQAAAGTSAEGTAEGANGDTNVSRVVLPESLVSAMEKRKKMLQHFWPLFEQNPLTWRPPQEGESVYATLDLEQV